MEEIINRFKEIVAKFNCDVIDMKSCSEQQLKSVIRRNGNKINRILIIKRK